MKKFSADDAFVGDALGFHLFLTSSTLFHFLILREHGVHSLHARSLCYSSVAKGPGPNLQQLYSIALAPPLNEWTGTEFVSLKVEEIESQNAVGSEVTGHPAIGWLRSNFWAMDRSRCQ